MVITRFIRFNNTFTVLFSYGNFYLQTKENEKIISNELGNYLIRKYKL